jgi:hypothetical protein
MMMDHFGVWPWLGWLIPLFLAGFPCWKIIKKAGFSGWWVLVTVIPVFNLIFLWVFAFIDWPVRESGSRPD